MNEKPLFLGCSPDAADMYWYPENCLVRKQEQWGSEFQMPEFWKYLNTELQVTSGVGKYFTFVVYKD